MRDNIYRYGHLLDPVLRDFGVLLHSIHSTLVWDGDWRYTSVNMGSTMPRKSHFKSHVLNLYNLDLDLDVLPIILEEEFHIKMMEGGGTVQG